MDFYGLQRIATHQNARLSNRFNVYARYEHEHQKNSAQGVLSVLLRFVSIPPHFSVNTTR
jgi:hypothetical protein